MGSAGEGFDIAVKIYADWDQDYIFNDDELVFSSPITFHQVSGSFTVPADMAADCRLRVVLSSDLESYACYSGQGEIEDYHLSNSQLDVTDITKISQAVIYPNPASEILNIEADQNILCVTLFDMRGRLIKTFYPNSNEAHLQISFLENALYFLKIQSENGFSTRKFLKE